jgi:hypothetical protein
MRAQERKCLSEQRLSIIYWHEIQHRAEEDRIKATRWKWHGMRTGNVQQWDIDQLSASSCLAQHGRIGVNANTVQRQFLPEERQ